MKELVHHHPVVVGAGGWRLVAEQKRDGSPGERHHPPEDHLARAGHRHHEHRGVRRKAPEEARDARRALLHPVERRRIPHLQRRTEEGDVEPRSGNVEPAVA